MNKKRIKISRENVFTVLEKEYSKNFNARDEELIKRCFEYFDTVSWLELSEKEQETLVYPFIKNQIDFNKNLYKNLFLNVRYVDSNFNDNRYIWDNPIWHNSNLQELREVILENDNDCNIYSLINGKKFYIVKESLPPDEIETAMFFKENPNIETLNAILSYYDYLELDSEKETIKNIVLLNKLQNIINRLNVESMKNNYFNLMK